MLIFKITLNASGQKLKPKNLVEAIDNKFIVAELNNPGDKFRINSDKIYDFGSISIWNPKKFGFQGEGVGYEEWFVNFIEKNYSKFITFGVEDITLFIEVYYSGGQCNFEIFTKDLLKRLMIFDVSLPISIYLLTEAEIQELLTL